MTNAFVASLLAAVILTAGARPDAGAPKKPVAIWDLHFDENDKKFGIEGSIFAIGDPVHETLTLQAVRAAGLAGPDATASTPAAIQYVRGVFWNDDPCAQLLFNQVDLMPTTGWDWYWDFHEADKRAAKGGRVFDGLKCKLVGRSHFGDLQFLHGMATDDGLPAATTRAQVLAWAKFVYGVATGAIDDLTALSAVPELKALPSLGAGTVRDLFRASNKVVVRERAAGSLLHLLQDSYAGGHVDRAENGEIRQFHSYARQDHAAHKKDDMWQGGGSDLERIRQLKGGAAALEASTEVLRLYKKKQPWADVEAYLLKTPLRLAKQTQPSGP
jgi:hypothetical protein